MKPSGRYWWLADGLEKERAPAVVEEPVGVAAVEVVLVVEEQIGHAVADEALHAAVLVPPSEGHVELADVLHLGLELVGDGGVLGHHDDDVGARLHERAGQEPATSPRPPVFTKGAASALANTICSFLSDMGIFPTSPKRARRLRTAGRRFHDTPVRPAWGEGVGFATDGRGSPVTR